MSEQFQQAVAAARAKSQCATAALKPSNAEVAIATQGIATEQVIGKVTLATLDKEREALIQQRIAISKQVEYDSCELQQVEIVLKGVVS